MIVQLLNCHNMLLQDVTPQDTVASEEEVMSRPVQSVTQAVVSEPMEQR